MKMHEDNANDQIQVGISACLLGQKVRLLEALHDYAKMLKASPLQEVPEGLETDLPMPRILYPHVPIASGKARTSY